MERKLHQQKINKLVQKNDVSSLKKFVIIESGGVWCSVLVGRLVLKFEFEEVW